MTLMPNLFPQISFNQCINDISSNDLVLTRNNRQSAFLEFYLAQQQNHPITHLKLAINPLQKWLNSVWQQHGKQTLLDRKNALCLMAKIVHQQTHDLPLDLSAYIKQALAA